MAGLGTLLRLLHRQGVSSAAFLAAVLPRCKQPCVSSWPASVAFLAVPLSLGCDWCLFTCADHPEIF